jgi:RND family efflux transporter MFP subunit
VQYTQITSPIEGVVADRPLYPGEMANPGSPLLVVMDVSRVIARASLPTGQLRYLKVGNRATLTGPDGLQYPGKVTVISPATDPNSTTAEVWVMAGNPGGQLRPGETAHVSILAETIKNAIVIPSSAIMPLPDGSAAAMVVGADSLAHEHKVKIGVRTDEVAQILEGISSGDKVIIAGALGLQDGARVRVETPVKHE